MSENTIKPSDFAVKARAVKGGESVAWDLDAKQPEGWHFSGKVAISADGLTIAVLALEGLPILFNVKDWTDTKKAVFIGQGLSQKSADSQSAEKDPKKKADGVRAKLVGFVEATFEELIERTRSSSGPNKVSPEALAIQTWLNTEGTRKGDPADRKVKMRANFLRAGIDPATIKTLAAFTQAFEKVLSEVFKLSGPGLETAKTKIPGAELKAVVDKAIEKAKGQTEVEETTEPVF